MTNQRTRIGVIGERFALEHYLRLDYTSVATNQRTRFGELDLIVRKDATLVFVEVKTRLQGSGNPLESFTRQKSRQVRKVAADWLAGNWLEGRVETIRLDAAAVVVTRSGALLKLECLEGAL